MIEESSSIQGIAVNDIVDERFGSRNVEILMDGTIIKWNYYPDPSTIDLEGDL